MIHFLITSFLFIFFPFFFCFVSEVCVVYVYVYVYETLRHIALYTRIINSIEINCKNIYV